jgi:hypothetical protein
MHRPLARITSLDIGMAAHGDHDHDHGAHEAAGGPLRQPLKYVYDECITVPRLLGRLQAVQDERDVVFREFDA